METSYRIRPRDQAVEMIECFILQNHLPAHARLPSERDMCDMWGISRTTLRFAIQRLICEGKLYSKVGSGTFVSAPKLLCNLQDLKSFSSFAREAGIPARDQGGPNTGAGVYQAAFPKAASAAGA